MDQCTTVEPRSKTKQGIKITPSLYSFSSIRLALLLTAGYFLLSFLLIGFKTEQVVLALFFNTLYFASFTTRRFIVAYSVFIIYWIIFDYMKAFPNFRFNEVHVQSLYDWEKNWFGFLYQGKVITPNEFFAVEQSTFLDLASGVFYLCWIPVPLLFASILFFKNRRLYFGFAFTFLLVNLIGFVGYYLYPAAPPWYVSQFGFDFVSTTPGNTAGLGRFDALTGIPVFKAIYGKSSNVFAAMPSLHAAYLVIVLFFGIKANFRYWNLLFGFIMLGIWFAAVYSSHHYVLDVLAGVFCALTGIALFQMWSITKWGKTFIDTCVQVCSV